MTPAVSRLFWNTPPPRHTVRKPRRAAGLLAERFGDGDQCLVEARRYDRRVDLLCDRSDHVAQRRPHVVHEQSVDAAQRPREFTEVAICGHVLERHRGFAFVARVVTQSKHAGDRVEQPARARRERATHPRVNKRRIVSTSAGSSLPRNGSKSPYAASPGSSSKPSTPNR